MANTSQDFRYAVRVLRNNPGFTAVAVFTLALGIGANTTIFSLINALVFRPLRLDDPDRVVIVSEVNRKGGGRRNPTLGYFGEFRKHVRGFQDIARGDLGGGPATLSGMDRAERVSLDFCTPNFFSMLGVKAFRGRTFLPEDAPGGESPTAVISQSLWQRSFAARPDILGQTVAVEGKKKTIVGVLPPGFSLLPWDMNVDVWLAYNPAGTPQSRWMSTIGRLRPSVSLEQAEAELNAIAQRLHEGQPAAEREWGFQLETLHEAIVGELREPLYVLLGAVGFVLLIGCANVANLLLARAAVREKEIAIRTSLGASRLRLVRQLLAESLLLGLVAGVFGILAAYGGIRILFAIVPLPGLMGLITLPVDLRVLGFTAAISVFTGIVFGLVPAIKASRPDLSESLKEGGRGSSGGGARGGLAVLLVCEVALAVVLLAGAGLTMSSFLRLQKVDLGYNPKNVMRADVLLAGPKYLQLIPGDIKRVTEQGAVFYDQVLERVRALPGVTSASISHLAPPGDVQTRALRIVGRDSLPQGQRPFAGYNEVSADFFRTLDIPLLKGRYLTERDAEGSPWVAVINDTMARRFFPNEDPIGKQVQLTILGGASNRNIDEGRPREIVGVVGNVRHFGFGAEPFPVMYGSYHQHVSDYPGGFYIGHLWKSITVRTASNPIGLLGALQKVVADVDKDQAVFNIMSLEQALTASLAAPRFLMRLFGIFGGLALLLAAVGIYGVMSYLVSQRTHEMGIRLALGAGAGHVLKLVLVRGLLTTAIGLAIGIAGSLALTRVIGGFLYGVKTTDPLIYGLVALVLTTVALAACYHPARRATKVDPLTALRHE